MSTLHDISTLILICEGHGHRRRCVYGASAARKEQEHIKKLVCESVKEHLGEEWGAMSSDEQDAAVRVW